jgi:hypothetical protein
VPTATLWTLEGAGILTRAATFSGMGGVEFFLERGVKNTQWEKRCGYDKSGRSGPQTKQPCDFARFRAARGSV